MRMVKYRLFCAAKFEDVIYVLHVFAKKTQKTSALDIELGKKRYRELRKGLDERLRNT